MCVTANVRLHAVGVCRASEYVIALALDPMCGNVNPGVFLMPVLLMRNLRKLNLSSIKCCLSVSSFGAWPYCKILIACHIVVFGNKTISCKSGL